MDVKREKKYKILVADDSEMNRSILADILGDEYEILEAQNGLEAVAVLRERGPELSLVLLDIVMPGMDGFEVLAVMNKNRWIEDIPVIMISAESSASHVDHAYELGVTDYISRPFDAAVVHRRVVNTILLYAKQKKLVGMVSDQIYEKERRSSLMIDILSHIVEFRNGESGLHVLHIHTITEILLEHLLQKTNKYSLKYSDISLISTASALHDIGKISVPDEILNKPGRLTKEEFEVIKTHSQVGASMLTKLPFQQDEPFVKTAYEICRWHHERYDGKGYPDGLKGEEIPIAAQIVALADVYDALTSERVYKKAYSHEKAVEMILNGECGQFNPLLLECLTEAADMIRTELNVHSFGPASQREIQKLTEEFRHHEELSASERTLHLLEHEREKYRFFASMSMEIQFEYTVNPPMLTLSEWGAARLGEKELVMRPHKDKHFLEIFGKTQMEEFFRLLLKTTPENPVMQYQCRIWVGGQERWHRIISRATWSADEKPQFLGAIGKAVDIHEECTKILDLEHSASHDGMTGLLNYASSKKIIQERMAEVPGKRFALIILDLDYFKRANDQHGHMFGDQLLKYFAGKLRQCIRGGDVVARVGGDEFVIFLEYKASLEQIVNRIFHSLLGEYGEFKISVSMGVAKSSLLISNYEMILHCADRALYFAKRSGRGRYSFYDETMKDMFSVISPIDEER